VQGLLTTRDLRFVDQGGTVASRMTPRDRLVAHTGEPETAQAEDTMRKQKIKKLPLLNADGTLRGLITAKDLVSQRQLPFATRDAHGRLRVGAAIGAKGDYLERAAELLRAEVDVIVIDIAHGHSAVMARAIEAFRKRFGDVELVAGNVATADGVRFLFDHGVDGIKVGIGPGGGCTTRLNTNFGVPQVQALAECRAAAGGRVPLIADGGVKRHGALVQALTFGGDTVMLGSVLAGTAETPGDIVQKPVVVPDSNKTVRVPFKVFRGMASLEAIVDRLDVEDADAADVEALGAEGMEISVPARGSVRPLLRDMLKHLCSAISYSGARSLSEMQEMFRKDPQRYVIRLSESSRRESFDR
jgi:IMP dehydrogenase